MLEIANVALPLDAGLPEGKGLVFAAAARALGVSTDGIRSVRGLRRSVDARKKHNVHFVATLGVELVDAAAEERLLAAVEGAKSAAVAVDGDSVRRGGAEDGRSARLAGYSRQGACRDDAAGGRSARPGGRGRQGAPRAAAVKQHVPYEPLSIPDASAFLARTGGVRPVVVGSGPAGLFAALYLARAGLAPLVLERGGAVDERVRAVEGFAAGDALDLQTNVQFGEGGAGTFSDGKLTTNAKNPLTKHVLHWFAEAGAPEDILVLAKPHIGTDLLRGVVRALRNQIEQAGGEVRFHAQLTGLRMEGGSLAGIEVTDTRTGVREERAANRLVLACGHSARDTFQLALDAGLALEQKPFSVGVRIEHPQALIDQVQYGGAAGHPALGAADYKLAVHLPGGRGVYTFCMCPGGKVVAAASEEGGVVVNGMSRRARDGRNANSALLVGVDPADFGSSHPLAGVELQRRIERAAYRLSQEAGGPPFAAPAQTVGDFLAGAHGRPSAAVDPTYPRGVAWCDLRECLPPFAAGAIAEALPLLDRKLRGFAHADAVMTGVETRSSSPVRIVRDASLQAVVARSLGTDVAGGAGGPADGKAPGQTAASAARAFRPAEELGVRGSGLYPCGEGAGYAGGIMSAAADGLRVAIALTEAIAGVS